MPYSKRLSLLHTTLERHGVDGVVIPRTNLFQGEYVRPAEERLAWISGFTGSDGLAIVLTKGNSALFVDGRYTLQAQQQSIDFDIFNRSYGEIRAWFEQHMPKKGLKIFFDPWLHTVKNIQTFERECPFIAWTPSPKNIIDEIWHNRPGFIYPLPRSHEQWSGQCYHQKIQKIQNDMLEKDVHLLLIFSPESVNWLLNIRGSDTEYTPVFYSVLLVQCDGTLNLFLENASQEIKDFVLSHFNDKISCHSLSTLDTYLTHIPCQTKIWADPSQVPEALSSSMRHLSITWAQDPSIRLRSIKNHVEIQGAKNAHQRDGVALVKFLSWLYKAHASQTKDLTEESVSDQLEAFRCEQNFYQGPSFPTISAAAEHGAIVHYRATPETNKTFSYPMIYLLDSGGQYCDGTTDVTRTLFLGDAPTEEQKKKWARTAYLNKKAKLEKTEIQNI